MAQYDGFQVTLFGVDGSRWDVHGPNAGRQGVVIGEGQLSGILDAPLESAWSETARGGGARHIRDRYLPRDMTVGFHVDGQNDPVRGMTAAAFSRALTAPPYRYSPTKRHARIELTSELSGTRTLRNVRGTEVPEINTGRDVVADAYENPIYSLRTVGAPWWYAGTLSPSFETDTEGTSSGYVTVENPGNVPAAYSIILTPGEWRISDPSWTGEIGEVEPGGPHRNRVIQINVPPSAGGAVLSRDPSRLPVAAADGSNLISQQEGRFLLHDIPPWTPPTDIFVFVSNAPPGGARAEYRIDEAYTSAWGMEAPLPGEID